MSDIEKRVTDLEVSVRTAKAIMGALGITAVLLFGYVTHLKGVAEEASSLVDATKEDAIVELSNESESQIKKIKDTTKSLFTESCSNPPPINSCSDNNVWLSCPAGHYLKKVKNRAREIITVFGGVC